MRDFIIDIHCHSQLKAYAHSFDKSRPTYINSTNPNHKNSSWWSDWPDTTDIRIQVDGLFGLTKFSQADYRKCLDGNLGIVFSSLYPIERGFVNSRLGSGPTIDKIINHVTEFGEPRINFAQKLKDYFPDLENEYKFSLAHSGKIKKIDGGESMYKFVANFAEVQSEFATTDAIRKLLVINTIEGTNALGSGIEPFKAKDNLDKIIDRIQKIKAWRYPPFFITFAHHFYNEFCGHAQSLGTTKLFLNQKKGLNTEITQTGWKILEALVKKDNGKRIIIDVKHMSYKARLQYYAFRAIHLNDIPIIASHAGVTGEKQPNVESNIKDAGRKFNSKDINFFDHELISIAESGGLFGIQLDERRIASKSELSKVKRSERTRLLYHAAGLVWNQIQHIAEILDAEGRFAWNIQCLGSDFDGVVDPIDGYFTSAHLKNLQPFLLMHAHNYMREKADQRLTQDFNKEIHEEEIIDRFVRENVMDFLEKHFI